MGGFTAAELAALADVTDLDSADSHPAALDLNEVA